jgi:opacity protein-like surface antigen
MKTFALSLLALLLSSSAFADAKLYAEAGLSHVVLRDARYEAYPSPLAVSEDRRQAAPFIAAGYSFNPLLGLRLSYHFIDDLSATTQFPHPPGPPGQPVIALVTWGHYRDDVHLLSLAPELKWPATGKLTFILAPALNWVASRGEVSYSFTGGIPFVPVLPRGHRDSAFTFGGSVGAAWSVSTHVALSIAYQYADLEPSFERTAHVFSGALRWNF